MKTKIQKWGNSLGVRLPKAIAQQKDLQEGAAVMVALSNDQIVIEPVTDEPSLESLLAGITPENLPAETDWSDAYGKEVW